MGDPLNVDTFRSEARSKRRPEVECTLYYLMGSRRSAPTRPYVTSPAVNSATVSNVTTNISFFAARFARRSSQQWHDRDTYMADQMIALYWGMKGRKIAREVSGSNIHSSSSLRSSRHTPCC